jgi:Uncharacterized protein conserved in bacteria (DUF2252)
MARIEDVAMSVLTAGGPPDPACQAREQAKVRVPDLVPVRWGRVMISPLTFYHDAASPMASDLAATPVSGLAVQVCRGAHLSNSGIFGSAERRLVFDVNDFDETLSGSWEWDVKRLAAALQSLAGTTGWRARTDHRQTRPVGEPSGHFSRSDPDVRQP